MNWLARARRELAEGTAGRTAETAKRPSNGSNGSTLPERFPDLEALHAEYEERAAIIEFDGGLPRHEAERRARELVYGPHSVHLH